MRWTWILALLGVTGSALSDSLEEGRRYSFDELYAIGLKHNLQVETARIGVEGLDWDRMEAIGTFLPSLSLSTGFNRSEQEIADYQDDDGSIVTLPQSIKTEQAGNSWSLSASQDLFKGFKTWSDYRQASLVRDEVLAGEGQAELQLRHDLLKQAHWIIAKSELLVRDQELLKQVEEQHRLATARFEVGAVTELDVLQTEIDLGNQQITVERSQQDLAEAWDGMAVLLGLEPGGMPVLEMDLETFEPTWQSERLVEMAEETRPEIATGRRNVEIARWATRSTRSAFLPTLSLDFQYSRFSNRQEFGDLDFFPENNSTWIGLNARLPLFTGFATTNAWQHSKADERRRQMELAQERRVTRAAIIDALRRLRSSYEQSRLTAKNRELAERSLDMEQERYRQGLATLLNVQSARATFREAEAGHIQQQLDFRDRLAALELSIGRKLTP